MATLLQNTRANFDFDIMETFQAGIDLHGFEVKSIKQKQGSLKGSYITVDESGAFLVNAHIPPYQAGNTPESYDPYRARKLLLTKKELAKLIGKEKEKGLTIVPVKCYTTRNLVKVDIAVARGKKKHDKRETLKKKTAKRDIDRALKSKY